MSNQQSHNQLEAAPLYGRRTASCATAPRRHFGPLHHSIHSISASTNHELAFSSSLSSFFFTLETTACSQASPWQLTCSDLPAETARRIKKGGRATSPGGPVCKFSLALADDSTLFSLSIRASLVSIAREPHCRLTSAEFNRGFRAQSSHTLAALLRFF